MNTKFTEISKEFFKEKSPLKVPPQKFYIFLKCNYIYTVTLKVMINSMLYMPLVWTEQETLCCLAMAL